ncbi:MAG: leucine--tRNA ligase [Legionellales bacterium]|nr:leucine--tRNA ligase [Legionellales bacterium]|tara:strand:- start:60537 stop:63044 length:2508 start_codon:yes stop_codon:yes gene_type:complete
MDKTYDSSAVEAAAQTYWDEQNTFKATEDLSKEKFYCSSMFPYPSGQLHMGHVRNYSLGDVIARYQRMLGKNVLHPIGWDAFGLPAENAAIQHKVAPAEWTRKNINAMREQFKRLGLAYDWHREFATCDPDYYRWEQWLFTKLFEKGLVYKKKSIVNWDPVDNTVLANEQVIDGRGWRSGAEVERREIPQWFIKITAYADELVDSLDNLTGWPEQVRTMQKNWIGRSHGVDVRFDVNDGQAPINIFTTRLDTLLGCTYLAVAPQHPLAKLAAKNSPAMQDFLAECNKIKVAEAEMATIEKKGVDTGFKAIHPITGDELPIWVANFVLMEYGSGAVMSVPAHDQRDFEFATVYGLPIKQVIVPNDGQDWDFSKAAYGEKGKLMNSGEFDGLDYDAATDAIANYLEQHHHCKRVVHYRLRDWGVSRQRYWGTPIPMIDCPSCGDVAVPDDQLPVVLPEDVSFEKSLNPLKSDPSFYETTCPHCGAAAKRETDTFDTFVESSWYYTRYCSYNQDKAMLDDRAKYWCPMDQYVGGIEHAVMHLLYARFFHKLLRDEGLLNSDEPFARLLTQGMVLKDGAKMSKSKGNTVAPTPLIEEYGADTVRLFSLFAAPPEQSLEWSDAGVQGANRFLKRLWSFAHDHRHLKEYNRNRQNGLADGIDWSSANETVRDARRNVHQILKQINYDYERLQFNTVVSGSMKLLNILEDVATTHDADKIKSQMDEQDHVIHEGLSIILRVLAPITPHISHALWRSLQFGDNILTGKWPKVANEALKQDALKLVVQVNGKLRSNIAVPVDAPEDQIQAIALADEAIQKHLDGKNLKKFIYVPGKLVNLVVGA